MLSDGHDHLTYETVSSRLVPLHHARGMGYFDLYTSQSHHPRRFARRLHSYAQDTVTLFSSQDLHYLNRRQNKDLFRHRPIDQQAMADTITAQAVKDQEALIKSLQGA